ncbi:MAG: glycosyltransferase family 2 protein [Bacteroidales bacterium]|nr:glycosyltransferase family 2 protein [Bacteroidales bacterium]
MTKLTFVCPCYNHEKYVLDFLNSLLKQTDSNWELIIIDDCSLDDSVARIKTIQDDRIRLFQNNFNQGINASFSKGIGIANTELISFVASDDMLYSDYVETMFDMFEQNQEIAACYTPLSHMNLQGKLLSTSTSLPTDKSEMEIFAQMFLNENLLPSPGMVFRKSILAPYLPLNSGMFQYSDYQMHFYLLFKNKIKFLDKALVQYRISPKSACARSPEAILREDIETEELMNTVLHLIGKDKASFLKYFGDYSLINNNEIYEETIPFWFGRLAMASPIAARQKWGLKIIRDFIACEDHMKFLQQYYNFSYKDYLGYASLISASSDQNSQTIQKYKQKIKKLKKIRFMLVIICLIMGVCLCL